LKLHLSDHESSVAASGKGTTDNESSLERIHTFNLKA